MYPYAANLLFNYLRMVYKITLYEVWQAIFRKMAKVLEWDQDIKSELSIITVHFLQSNWFDKNQRNYTDSRRLSLWKAEAAFSDRFGFDKLSHRYVLFLLHTWIVTNQQRIWTR